MSSIKDIEAAIQKFLKPGVKAVVNPVPVQIGKKLFVMFYLYENKENLSELYYYPIG
jgi:hypothetical protein